MRTFYGIVFLLSIILFTGCKSNEKWEYKVMIVSTEGYDRTGTDAFKVTKTSPTESELNKLGADGWELATSYLEMETSHPNFGNDTYVTGLQANIRPQRAILIFKRVIKK